MNSDLRPLSVETLINGLHKKFGENFLESQAHLNLAASSEARARQISIAKETLECQAGQTDHQISLAQYLDEIFADIICAIYLASTGLDVPARMLLRRSLELGVVIISHWDAPVSFYAWKDHDSDVRFSELCQHIQSAPFSTFLKHKSPDQSVDLREVCRRLENLYGKLSNVVHPKPYNFKTTSAHSYAFNAAGFSETLALCEKVEIIVIELLLARFPELRTPFAEIPVPEKS